ncbi:MAG: hybrid sensor histidine kinase/response regulator [Methylococcaceae bacterium]|nr:hybrid sensor histidine kinase/response regulator [Methylococcaceae bacterium]
MPRSALANFTDPRTETGGSGRGSTQLDRMRAEQIETLYRNAPLGVVGAGISGLVLAYVLVQGGTDSIAAITVWLAFLWADVLAHLLLYFFRGRSGQRDAQWRNWAIGFTLVSFAEGLTWGLGSVLLAPASRLDQQIWIMLVTSGVTSGAASAFGSYLPAFYFIMLPAMIPYFAWSVWRGEGLHDALAALDLIYISAMSIIAWRSNGSLVEALRLRFENIDLAERLKFEKERAEQANLAKSRFLASASHDLRQPVHALGMFVGALRVRSMDDEARRIVEHIDGSLQSLDGLFSSLLDISRLDAGVVQTCPQNFPIQPLLKRICDDHASEAAGNGIRLVQVPCSASVSTDPILLERILRNLLSNALRNTHRGRVMVGCRRGERLSIEIWDTGCGIPKEKQQLIFQEFYQIGNPERDRALGLGLGLAIVKRLTTLLDCGLTLASKPGKGSVFKVSVPFAEPLPEILAETREVPIGTFRHGLILVIDDETEIQQAMCELLSSWGHRVIAAGSGDEMLARIATCSIRPDLILSDYRLRGEENGIAVIHRLQSEYNEDIPAMLITGDTAPDRLTEAQQSGFLLLHKPVPNARLRAAIGNLIASHPAPD